MKGIVIVSPGFFKIFMAPWVSGIALFPFILIKNKQMSKNVVLINHERIHIQQQKELLIIFFYLWYGLEYLFRWVQTGSRRKAYKNISFEREAYAHEHDLTYLQTRKFCMHFRWL